MKKTILAVVTALCFSGCGGGGGGGGGAVVQFTGNTNQATVTSSNAKAVSVDAVASVQNVATLGALAKTTGDTKQVTIQLVNGIVEETLLKSLQKTTAKTVAGAVSGTVSGTELGYAGSFAYSVTVNSSTGAASGSIVFSAYQADAASAKVSGSVSFSATVNLTTGAITTMQVAFSNVSAVSSLESATLNGSISLDRSGSSTILQVSVVETNSATNKTYWMRDLTLTLSGSSLTVTGTYYDYNHGYVTISTPTPLTVSNLYGQPVAGTLLFVGSGNSKARITYTNTGYILEVDANGTNTFVAVP